MYVVSSYQRSTLIIITIVFLVILIDNLNKYRTPWLASPKSVEIVYINNASKCNQDKGDDPRIRILLELWKRSLIENVDLSDAPRAPHFQDCRKCSLDFAKLDTRAQNRTRPNWTNWRGSLGLELGTTLIIEDGDEEMLLNTKHIVEGPFTPWVKGSDEDNLPLTRRVQRDIWLHQHPQNCSSSKFLLADWQTSLTRRSIGVGAEIVAMTGLLAVALKDNRVLVTKGYHGANHTGCTGSSHARWSCYFVPEASEECITRALSLASDKLAWKQGIITGNKNYSPNAVWKQVPVPNLWGKPWEHTQKTAQLNGKLISDYAAEDRRWWRSQAFRYLMRFPSEYLCTLLNHARHEAFGMKAAEIVLHSLPPEWPKVPQANREPPTAIEKLVWSSYEPWLPRPLVSVHVRQGDKGWEMQIFAFKDYMKLAERLHQTFPHAHDIWLSTEMQNVVDESRSYSGWNFYYTNISRQTGSKSMVDYMRELGKMRNFNNALVNLMMATESDFFIGALGSTWSCLIDGLRMTNGKVMAGFLSVNPFNKLLK